MPRVNLQQNTREWAEWRSEGLGASDCATIMGTNPWKTARRLWDEIKGNAPKFQGNEKTQRGHKLEPEARSLYNLLYGTNFQPACWESWQYPWLRASLDGVNEDETEILEIKCPGEKVFREIQRTRKVPSYYLDNSLQQLLVVETAKIVRFVAYYPNESLVVIPIEMDVDRIAEIVGKTTEFWNYVTSDTPPPTKEDEYIEIQDEEAKPVFEEALEYVKRIDMLKLELKALEKEFKPLKKQVEEFTDSGNCYGFGLKITERSKKGSIDYERLFSELDIDLETVEKYRKPKSYWLELSEMKK